MRLDSGRAPLARPRMSMAIHHADTTGSIHRVGAVVQGAPACNGWSFWHVKREGALVSIDHFRQQLRAELF